jgi:radical SAM superfamily enzyme YgiQ (UPF0313 family)
VQLLVDRYLCKSDCQDERSNTYMSLISLKLKTRTKNVCLIMAPYFVPWAPPLGITTLKAHLEAIGHSVNCIDLNVDRMLWSLHLRYVSALESDNPQSKLEGQYRVWAVRNAHLLALVNGADEATSRALIRRLVPLYGLKCSDRLAATLTEIASAVMKRAEEMLEAIDLSRVDVLGTSTFSTSLALSLLILRIAKAKFPQIKTVMGGGVFADDLAPGSDNLKVLLENYPCVDHVIVGEGELLFAELLAEEFESKRMVSVKDVSGQFAKVSQAVAPDFSDLQMNRYFHLAIEGGRSCPFQCSFCSETVQWGPYRKKPQALVAEQMVSLATKHGNNRFFMSDSLMNPYIENLSRELLDKTVKVTFDGYLRADTLAADPQRTKRWAQSGCYRVRLGIESASSDVLAAMDKRTTPATISAALRSLSEAGIRTTTYWVVGYPGETEDAFQETVRFIRENSNSIYEVEAHDFHYYPTGQVASNQWPALPMYDDDITKWTRFQVWDADTDPPRAERYRRLAGLTTVARQLDIQNLYSYQDRFVADQRWLSIHGNATVAY